MWRQPKPWCRLVASVLLLSHVGFKTAALSMDKSCSVNPLPLYLCSCCSHRRSAHIFVTSEDDQFTTAASLLGPGAPVLSNDTHQNVNTYFQATRIPADDGSSSQIWLNMNAWINHKKTLIPPAASVSLSHHVEWNNYEAHKPWPWQPIETPFGRRSTAVSPYRTWATKQRQASRQGLLLEATATANKPRRKICLEKGDIRRWWSL